jgi:hypothetical protein
LASVAIMWSGKMPFSSGRKLSDTDVLVKNIPDGASGHPTRRQAAAACGQIRSTRWSA